MITLFLSFLRSKIVEKKIIDKIIIFYMTLFYGFRYDVGIDYLSYEQHYYDNNGFYGQLEFLYDLSMKIFRLLNMPFFVFMIFIGFLIFLYLYKISIYIDVDYSLVVSFFIMTGMLFVSFNLIRQTLAGVIVLFSFKYINTSNFKKYILTMGIAILIHYSAIIFIPFYFIEKTNVINRNWFSLLAIGIFLYYTNILNSIIAYIIPGKYAYLINGEFSYEVHPGLGVIFFIIVAVILATNNKKFKGGISSYKNFYILGYTVLLFTMNIFVMTRLNTYSQLAIPFVLSNRLKSKNKKIDIYEIMLLLITIGFFVIFLSNILNIYRLDPNRLMYHTIFNK